MSEDKRKFPHVHLRQPVAVTSGEGQTLVLAELENLTVEGASFATDRPFLPGAKMYVVFPGGAELHENEIASEVIRCEKLEYISPASFGVAVKFTEPNDTFLMDALALVNSGRL